MPNRKFSAVAFLFGAIALGNALRNPRLEAIHTSDMLQLIGSGLWFGVGLAWLFGRMKPRSKD